jgi:hypothetical protein
MTKTTIHYLFPPDKINELETWRFVLHFKAPQFFRERKIKKVTAQLKTTTFKAATFPFGLDNLVYDKKSNTLDVPIEIPEDRRKQQGSLAAYESDVWKIYASMAECGFGDLYYEAIDWKG